MRWTVRANESSAVENKNDMKMLKCHIMDNLVKCTLEKCRIDRSYRYVTFRGHSGGKCHGMLFRDANIEKPFRHFFLQIIQPSPVGHSSSNTDNLLVFLRDFDQSFSEDFGQCGRAVFFELVR